MATPNNLASGCEHGASWLDLPRPSRTTGSGATSETPERRQRDGDAVGMPFRTKGGIFMRTLALVAVLVGSLAAPFVHEARSEETKGWAAWIEMPNRRLHVVGAVLAPNPGYEARLERTTPPTKPSRDYDLRLVLS